MEDKQLNFNQPFLSVRRYSATPVAEKEDRKNSRTRLPSAPRPPPYKSELKSGPVRNAGTVPFVWEQSPGRSKGGPHADYPEISTAPKLPPGRIPKADQQEPDNACAYVYPTAEKIQQGNFHTSYANPVIGKANGGLQSAEGHTEEEENSDSTDDEVFEDALDTLSRTESFFFNCSVSGVSGFEDVKPPQGSSADSQAKDFMIGRFLPAAKAMVSESPQLTPKKQHSIPDQPRQPKKVVNGDKGPQLRYGPSFAKQHSEYYDMGEVSGGEESNDDFDATEVFPAGVCGLVPRFFLKGSHCLINRIPAKSVRTRPPVSPASRTGTISSSASYWSKTENEHSSFDTSERKSIDESHQTELHEDKNDLNMKSNQISSKLEDTYPLNSINTSDLRHYPRESKNKSNVGFNSHEYGYKSFKELLADKNSPEEVAVATLEVENTLYVESVHKLEPIQEKLSPFVPRQSDQDHVSSRKGKYENFLPKSSMSKESNAVSEKNKPLTDLQKLSVNLPLLSDAATQNLENKASKAFQQDQNRHQDRKWKFDTLIVKEQTPKAENLEKSHETYPDFSIPPPLPKSPSDSWLWRTLPSISSKTSSLCPPTATGPSPMHQTSKTQPGDNPKWENMVKTSKAQVHHLRYSEELLAPIPEN